MSDSGFHNAPPLAGERVAFTGTLASMTHGEASELAVQHGGMAMQHVGQQTTMLVIGEEGWPLESDGHPSQKLEQTLLLIGQGQSIRVLGENEWLALLGMEVPKDSDRRWFTPAMLSRMLSLPTASIRHWERIGLLHAVRRVRRLPYFDFREVARVKEIASLMNSGIPSRRLLEGLKSVGKLWKQAEQSISQLELLVEDRRLLLRDDRGVREAKGGQRLFVFDGDQIEAEEDPILPFPRPNSGSQQATSLDPGDWLVHAERLQSQGLIAEAIESCRAAAMLKPGDAAIHFQMADLHFRLGNYAAAIERYYVAIEIDHQDIESWTQLGCVYRQQGEYTKAIEAFDTALEIHPDSPEAHFHLAEVLEITGEREASQKHWAIYLQFDSHGPWAEIARQKLQNVND